MYQQKYIERFRNKLRKFETYVNESYLSYIQILLKGMTYTIQKSWKTCLFGIKISRDQQNSNIS